MCAKCDKLEQWCRKIIETVVEEKSDNEDGVGKDVGCTAYEMMRLQLMQNNTKGKVFEYVNKVSSFLSYLFPKDFIVICENPPLMLCFVLLTVCDNLPNSAADMTVNCEDVVNMPHVAFIIGDKLFQITPI